MFGFRIFGLHETTFGNNFFLSFSETSSHLIAESYTKILKRLGAKNVDIHFMGQQTFAYTMNKVRTGRYITLTFTSSPRLLQIYEKRLKLDKNILRKD